MLSTPGSKSPVMFTVPVPLVTMLISLLVTRLLIVLPPISMLPKSGAAVRAMLISSVFSVTLKLLSKISVFSLKSTPTLFLKISALV